MGRKKTPQEGGQLAEGYRKRKIPATRLVGMEMVDIGMRTHYVSGLLEVDVTEARRIVGDSKARGTRVSFTAWIIRCLAVAARDFPEVNAFRKGRNLYLFENVNVGMPIEREFEGELVPLPYLIRDCNTKSVLEITREIDSAKESGAEQGMVIGDRHSAAIAKISRWLPAPLRRLGARVFMRNPVRKQETMGAVVITAVGMFGKTGGWPLPIPIGHPLAVAVGGISRKPAYIGDGDRLEPRELLDVTLMFDHDVIDGGPATRFSARLVELMESAYGLQQL